MRDNWKNPTSGAFRQRLSWWRALTVLVIITLTQCPVTLRFRCGSGNFVIISSWFAIFKNVVHSLEPGETPSNSKLCTTFLSIAKHDKTITKILFTGTAMKQHRNRKFCQFNNDQYCIMSVDIATQFSFDVFWLNHSNGCIIPFSGA